MQRVVYELVDDGADDALVRTERPYYRIQSVARMLGISESSVRTHEKDAGLNVEREPGPVAVRRFSVENVFALARFRREQGLVKPLPRPLVMTVYALKGGVGKSTDSVELAVHFQLLGYRVLLIDLDPQGSTTLMCGYDPEVDDDTPGVEEIDPDLIVRNTFANLLEIPPFIHAPAPLGDVLKYPYGPHGPHLIPADTTLNLLESALQNATMRDTRIVRWLSNGLKAPETRHETDLPIEKLDLRPYDVVIFDAAPATSIMTNNALIASHICLVPARLDGLSFKSLSLLANQLNQLKRDIGSCPKMLILPAFYTRRRSINANLDRLVRKYEGHLSMTMIRESVHFPQAVDTFTPLALTPRGTGSSGFEDLRELAFEILNMHQGADHG